MTGRLEGKTAFVTAAGQGMGRAAAVGMAREGARVYATDIDADALASLPGEAAGIETFVLDALDGAAIDAAPARVGVPDILFNCAGYVHSGTVLETTDEQWDFSFALNVKSHFRVIRAFLPLMLEAGGGSIINMASVASSIKGVPNRSAYAATKGAVIGLTKAVAADYVSRGIRCNALCPGTIDTPSLNERMRASGDYETSRKAFIARQPIGRLATAEEVVPLIIYLASDESQFVTGQTHIIDGGWAL
ncbi:2-keto-3-deoxy-L-fuconate dehydrogenase [Rhodoligotrophos appendicifer]|uniref:SDR family oxidoreductase n=1 Tax=Rhodoligotrophos appendicifer TaxID=987056 RepID=UPI00117D2823|nr:SDR family oxidoreductase [Rhodoligotrophos appendicifer]